MDRISGDIRKIGGRRCNCASAQESLRQKDRRKREQVTCISFLARVSKKNCQKKKMGEGNMWSANYKVVLKTN